MDPARRVCRWRAPAASGGLGRATSTTCAAFLADRLAIGETERFSIHRKCSSPAFLTLDLACAGSRQPAHGVAFRRAATVSGGSTLCLYTLFSARRRIRRAERATQAMSSVRNAANYSLSRRAYQLSARKSKGERKRLPPGNAGIFRSSNSFSRSRLPATVSA